MNTTSSIKVTVNGKKYLITGIQKATSCKDLLCTIAKATKRPLQQQQVIEKEKSLKSLYSVKHKSCDDNLLERWKGDRQIAGDYESLKIFNSLGRDAKIIAKEGNTDKISSKKEIVGVDELSPFYKKRKKKRKKKKVKLTEDKHSLKNNKKVTDAVELTRKHRVKHRSVDDSDIDCCKQDTLTRLKKRGRVYDDSDIDVYQSLFHMVIDQTKQLNKIQTQSKEVRKTEWIEQLRKTSQVYYIDDENMTNQNSHQNITSYGKDDGNDSGLPSPEYDSSESHENQPIEIQDLNSRDMLKKITEQTSVQNIDSALKENTTKGKQSFITKHNIQNSLTINRDNLQNELSDQCGNEQNKNELYKNVFVNTESDQIKNEQNQDRLIDQHENICRNIKDDKTFMFTEKVDGHTTEEDTICNTNEVEVIFDNNHNIIDTKSCLEEKNKMVAFDAALLQQKLNSNNNNKKKIDKKKIKKSDISEPLLLSPSTFKRHRSLKKIESVLGVKADVVLQKFDDDDDDVKKEKEKYLNKKLKEIRKNKKLQLPDRNGGKRVEFQETDIPVEEIKEVLEFNVFVKKDKTKKIKSKKGNNSEELLESPLKRIPSTGGTSNQKNTGRNRHSFINLNNVDRVSKIRNITSSPKKETLVETSNTSSSEKVTSSDTINTSSSEKVISSEIINTSSPNKIQQANAEKCNTNEEFSKKLESKNTCENNNKSSNSEKEIKDGENILHGCENGNSNSVKQNKNFITLQSHMSSTYVKGSSLAPSGAQNITQHRSDNNEQPADYHNQVDFEVKSADNISTTSYSLEDDQERIALLQQYRNDNKSLMELIEKILDYNLLISELSEELEILSEESNQNRTIEELGNEELSIYKELESVKSLLRSVSDLTNYQRKEMSENLTTLNRLDVEVRTKKAGYDNLRNGVWKTNSKSAPRSLIKLSKEKRKASQQLSTRQKSFV